MLEMIAGDLYLRHISNRGDITVSHHRYWDRDRLIAAKVAAGLVEKDGPAKVTAITAAEFKALGGRE